jgi:hypothetical protein
VRPSFEEYLLTPSRRTFWLAHDFDIVDEPLVLSLIKYRQKKNRQRVDPAKVRAGVRPNLVSSITDDGGHMMILDLDFPHHVEPSSTPGHNHIYFDHRMSKLQWLILMWALYNAGVIELGFFVWSLRRGGNFVRLPGVQKAEDGAEQTKPTYGWIFKLRKKK